jgi:hypothetical protein
MSYFIQFDTSDKKQVHLNAQSIEWVQELNDKQTEVKIAGKANVSILEAPLAAVMTIIDNTGGSKYLSKMTFSSF